MYISKARCTDPTSVHLSLEVSLGHRDFLLVLEHNMMVQFHHSINLIISPAFFHSTNLTSPPLQETYQQPLHLHLFTTAQLSQFLKKKSFTLSASSINIASNASQSLNKLTYFSHKLKIIPNFKIYTQTLSSSHQILSFPLVPIGARVSGIAAKKLEKCREIKIV